MRTKRIASTLAITALFISSSVISASTSRGATAVLKATCSLTSATVNVTSVPNGTQQVVFGFLNVKNSTQGPFTDSTAPYSWPVPTASSYSTPGVTKSVAIVALIGSNTAIARKTVSCT